MNTWIGRPVEKKNIPYSEIDIDTIPTFRREPFSINGVENPYLDTIIHKNGTPVATVSKSYSLIQHHTALHVTFKALESMGYSPKDAECELNITTLGERMWARIRFPGYRFDPGDGHVIHLELSLFNKNDHCRGWRAIGIICDRKPRFTSRPRGYDHAVCQGEN